MISIIPYKNVNATIYSIIVLILIILVYVLTFNSMQSDDFDLSSFDFYNVLFTCIWILFILSIVWSYKIAKQTGRDPSLWIFIGIFIGPLALLILSLKDYYIKNPTLRDEIIRTRLEYKKELNNTEEIKTVRQDNKSLKRELLNKYQNILVERSAKILTQDKLDTLKELLDNGIINSKIDLTKKKRLIEIIEYNRLKDVDVVNWNPEWLDDESVCPACGTKLDKNSENCLNCGLKVK